MRPSTPVSPKEQPIGRQNTGNGLPADAEGPVGSRELLVLDERALETAPVLLLGRSSIV